MGIIILIIFHNMCIQYLLSDLCIAVCLTMTISYNLKKSVWIVLYFNVCYLFWFQTCRLLCHISGTEPLEITCVHAEETFRVIGPQVNREKLSAIRVGIWRLIAWVLTFRDNIDFVNRKTEEDCYSPYIVLIFQKSPMLNRHILHCCCWLCSSDCRKTQQRETHLHTQA